MKAEFKKPRVTKAVKDEIKKEVTAMVKSKAEVKYIANQWDDVLIGAQCDTAAGSQLYPMMPVVAQGTDTDQRIGDSIKASTIRTKFVVYYTAPPSNSSYDVYIRVLCVTSKVIKSQAEVASIPGGNLLDRGNGTQTDVPNNTNTIANLEEYSLMPVNRKSWTVLHDKVIRLVKNTGSPSGATSTGEAPNLGGLSQHRFTFSTPHKGALKYEGASALFATNFAPFWCAYAWTSDGSAFPGSALPTFATRSEIYYTDT